MNRICLSLICLALISGCKTRPGSTAAPASDAAQEQPTAPRWTLSLAMVDGYLRYQRTLLVKAHPLQPAAGVEQRADLDEKARLEAGLTLDDVLKIEAMLGRVSARRLTFRLMELDEKMPEPPAADPQDSARTAEAAQAGQAQLKRAQLKKSIQNMTEERQAFGDQNIDVLLQREEELMKNWSLMMEVPELSQPGH